MAQAEETRGDYTVLARRYRPQSFRDVVGQEHVAQALKNAIASSRVAHAYLFTGARGVGKTSSARILAKSLNCPHAVDGEPCNACEICQSISTGSDVDVLEIDGASNRGIDDIRQLRQNVNVRSMRSKYKIYIIDEVHMLTKDAFNALLKTLEEPPPNVKFVFCTTEPNKVPDTILSRCQRFDFGTIATPSIRMRLQQIAESEGRQVDQDAVELIARRAAGSMRDSQSLFDQLLAFGSSHITALDVHRLLGTAPDERLIDLIQAVINRDTGSTLQQFQDALDGGVQLAEFTDQLLNYLRDLLIAASGAQNVPLQSVSDDNLAALKQQADQWGLRTIVAGMQILAEAKGRMRGTTYGRVLAELALVRLALLQDLSQIEQVLSWLKSGALPAAGGPALPASATSAPAAPRAAAPLAIPPKKPTSPAPAKSVPPEKKSEPAVEVATPEPEPEKPPEVEGGKTLLNSPEVQNPPSDAADLSIPQCELRPGTETEFWAQVVSQFNDMLGTYIKKGTPKGLNTAISGPKQLAIAFTKQYDMARQHCSRPENQTRLEQAAEKVAGQQVRLQFVTDTTTPAGPTSTPASATPKARGKNPRGDDVKDPFVRKAAEVFGGQIGEGIPIT